jgi:hypothetical protein
VRVTHFSLITNVERQLCIVNRGYAIVTKQQWGDRTNKFRSTLLKKSRGEQGNDIAICDSGRGRKAMSPAIDKKQGIWWIIQERCIYGQ